MAPNSPRAQFVCKDPQTHSCSLPICVRKQNSNTLTNYVVKLFILWYSTEYL